MLLVTSKHAILLRRLGLLLRGGGHWAWQVLLATSRDTILLKIGGFKRRVGQKVPAPALLETPMLPPAVLFAPSMADATVIR